MTTLVERLTATHEAIALQLKQIKTDLGDKNTLTTVNKTNLVNAINEVVQNFSTLQSNLNQLINDSAGAGNTTHTWSADKITTALNQLAQDILGGIPPETLNTIDEIATQLQADQSSIDTILNGLGNAARVDIAQSFNATQQLQVRNNIGAASQEEFTALNTAIGDINTDFLANFNNVLNS